MKAEKFVYEEHSKEVAGWLKKHAFPLPHKEMLSDVGFIVDDTACGFLYTSNSSIGWVEWIFSNPRKDKKHRAEALDILFKLLEETARNLNITVLFSAAAQPAYQAVLERSGFLATDQGITHYIKLLGDK